MTSSKRSRDEFRERAYVAASRRTDRNIKARMESAIMASEMHKKRTGKRLRITEDIVTGDAPYEEEQDSLLHQQTCSVVPKLSMGVEGISKESLTSAILAKTEQEWRENEINRLFAQAFPNFGRQFQLPVRTIPEEGKPRREPTSQNTEGLDQQRPHEHLQNGSLLSKPDEPAGDALPRPREDSLESLLGETPSLLGSDATTLTSCSPSFMPDLLNEAGMLSEFFDPNSTEGLYPNDYTAIGGGFSFKTDDFAQGDDINDWLQHVCDSGDMMEMTGWDSQPFDGTMDDWWPMIIDDSAQLATSAF
ncbi:hypothetical protein CDV36_008209 [Fusarium kuroshium]|uniref:Uncharacterized protein n=1 Tax=Fusarium kuroshium TaxID=2010991 RepID=A0A3M2S4F1_9HYPO|nr:hypothetical protein CDV36_008209 [Fusarium kuroshium]